MDTRANLSLFKSTEIHLPRFKLNWIFSIKISLSRPYSTSLSCSHNSSFFTKVLLLFATPLISTNKNLCCTSSRTWPFPARTKTNREERKVSCSTCVCHRGMVRVWTFYRGLMKEASTAHLADITCHWSGLLFSVYSSSFLKPSLGLQYLGARDLGLVEQVDVLEVGEAGEGEVPAEWGLPGGRALGGHRGHACPPHQLFSKYRRWYLRNLLNTFSSLLEQ